MGYKFGKDKTIALGFDHSRITQCISNNDGTYHCIMELYNDGNDESPITDGDIPAFTVVIPRMTEEEILMVDSGSGVTLEELKLGVQDD